MTDRTKRIFISDIHMGDCRSIEGPHPYCWFKNNINTLATFLDEQLRATDVKEVVILGDLFDQWVIPVDATPLISYDDICSNPANEPVIKNLKALAKSPDVKLSYVPGNHDMSMNADNIVVTKQFLEKTFPGIRYFCSNNVPLGTYCVGTLAAEHGDRYCLFNAPDTWTPPQNTYLPLGYFISRLVAYKVATKGSNEDYHVTFENFMKDFLKRPDFVEDLLAAIAEDAGLNRESTINLLGVPGFDNVTTTVGDIGKRFRDLTRNWERTPDNINVPTAIIGDIGNLSYAASIAYLQHAQSNANIVIFGHTHQASMLKNPVNVLNPDQSDPDGMVPSGSIYANCGTWVDSAEAGCTYVETEEVPEKKRHFVRVKEYPTNATEHAALYEGFVDT